MATKLAKEFVWSPLTLVTATCPRHFQRPLAHSRKLRARQLACDLHVAGSARAGKVLRLSRRPDKLTLENLRCAAMMHDDRGQRNPAWRDVPSERGVEA
jgi:hypothetical protein